MEKKQSATEIAAEFYENIQRIDDNETRTFINEVVTAIAAPLKKIPEPVFKEIFLPYFIGQKQSDSSNDAVAHWAGLIGSYTEPAEVVNVKGETVFVVPPICDTTNIGGTGKGKTFGSIMAEYEDQSRVHPTLGKEVIARDLSQKYANTLDGTAPSPYSWDPILEFYGITSKKIEEVKRVIHGDDDLIYDDD